MYDLHSCIHTVMTSHWPTCIIKYINRSIHFNLILALLPNKMLMQVMNIDTPASYEH